MDDQTNTFDCIVIGSGHAGSCAALSAVEAGCRRVLIVEKAPQEWAGGNGFFTAGAFRTVHNGLADLSPIVHNISPELAEKIDMEPYTAQDFTNDIMRLSDGRSDPALVQIVVEDSRETVEWLARNVRVPFVLSFNRQAYEVCGRQKFWGGMVLGVKDGGKGLLAAHQRALTAKGITVWYNTPAIRLLQSSKHSDAGAIAGVVLRRGDQEMPVHAPSVILAAGGFESSVELRVKHLGEDWANARVRGTPYNTGDGIEMALSIGAMRAGDWSYNGCHSTCWDARTPADAGSRTLSNQFTKSGYPLGLMLNTQGLRFVDEGADFRNYTYAKYGRAILAQPEGVAFQIFDQRVIGWLRKEEYSDEVVHKVYADSIDELAQKLIPDGLQDCARFTETIRAYNKSVYAHRSAYPSLRWDPSVKDGLSTYVITPTSKSDNSKHEASFLSTRGFDVQTITPPKTNWALPLDNPPFLAVKVACGITFTFGGVAIDPKTASVLRKKPDGTPIDVHDCHTPAHRMNATTCSRSFPDTSPRSSATTTLKQILLQAPYSYCTPSERPSEGTVIVHEDEGKPTPVTTTSYLGGDDSDELNAMDRIPGLFCTGEMVGGLFYGNYPGGSGLTAGAVFGRRAGRAASEFVHALANKTG